MHVAGLSRVEQDQPGNVALIYFSVLSDCSGAVQECFIAKIQHGLPQYIRISAVDHFIYYFEPAVFRIQDSLLDPAYGIAVQFFYWQFCHKIGKCKVVFALVFGAAELVQHHIDYQFKCFSSCCFFL